MDLKSAQGVIRPAKGKTFDPSGIPDAVKAAGFTAGEIEVTAAGTLARQDGSLVLETPGVVRHFLLSGGAKAAELGKRKELVGKRVQVTGKFEPSRAGRPAALTVESWK